MKPVATSIFVLSMLAPAASAQGGPGQAVEQLHLAIAKSDRAAAAAVLAADVQIFESGSVERSRDEYLSHHFDADAKFAKGVRRTVLRHGAQVSGTMALVLEETETTGSYDGRPVSLAGTETAVLRLEGGAWQIVHLHWSSRRPMAR